MEYRIIEKGASYIVGIHKRVSLQYEGVNPEIAAMWESLTEEDITTLKGLSNLEPTELVTGYVMQQAIAYQHSDDLRRAQVALM